MDFLKKTVIIQWKGWTKGLLLLTNKLIEKLLDPRDAKERYQSFLRKKYNSKAIRNNFLSTQKIEKPKHCWYKIKYYRTSKNFT